MNSLALSNLVEKNLIIDGNSDKNNISRQNLFKLKKIKILAKSKKLKN